MAFERYTSRFYRKWQNAGDLTSFIIRVEETDLVVLAECDVSEKAKEAVRRYRNQIETTIKLLPSFLTSLEPINLKSSFKIINEMVQKANLAGVGPMAGVAGAIAEYAGKDLLSYSKEIIIENGGDIFISSKKDRILLVYAGESSPFKNRLKLKVSGNNTPCGICTSSARIGHSLSFGNTDATVIIAHSTVTADILATAVGNIIKTDKDLEKGMEFAKSFKEVIGGLILFGNKACAWGKIEFV